MGHAARSNSMESLPFGAIVNPEDYMPDNERQILPYSAEYGLYHIIFDPIATYRAWAFNAGEALDIVVDYCEAHNIQVWLDDEELSGYSEEEETALTFAGNHGLPLAEGLAILKQEQG
jgi:hypothetical protein